MSFEEEVAQRHAQQQPFSSSEIGAMTSEQFKTVLSGAASVQRAYPESVMLRAQRRIGSGLYAHSLEHIGDLTHRIAESGGRFGTEFVKPKVESQLHNLTRPYGYEREMREQLASNNRIREEKGKPVLSEENLHEIGHHYSEAHATVPVYTEPMHHARAAAMSLGLRRFGDTVQNLGRLQHFINGGNDHWNHLMSQPESVRFLRSQGR